MSMDLHRICGPLSIELWVDLADFVVAWEAEEVALSMVCLRPCGAADVDAAEFARHLELIAETLESDDFDIARMDAAPLARRVREALDAHLRSSKGGDA